MDEQELIRLGMFACELQHLQNKYGLWVQDAEVYMASKTDPIAKIGAGSGSYCIQII